MEAITFDTGALIAADRGERGFWIFWKLITTRGIVASVPSPVIAEAWRGARCARMARVLSGCRPVELDVARARRVGELCARAKTADIVDASVVVVAASSGADVLTSDADDIRRLAAHEVGVGRVVPLASLKA